jgi:hypothetical protein
MNAAGELMKAVPEFSGPPATAVEAAAETGRVYLLLTGVLAITAAAVVLVHGPRTLAGRHADLADFQASRTLGIGDEQQRRAGVPPVA